MLWCMKYLYVALGIIVLILILSLFYPWLFNLLFGTHTLLINGKIIKLW